MKTNISHTKSVPYIVSPEHDFRLNVAPALDAMRCVRLIAPVIHAICSIEQPIDTQHTHARKLKLTVVIASKRFYI